MGTSSRRPSLPHLSLSSCMRRRLHNSFRSTTPRLPESLRKHGNDASPSVDTTRNYARNVRDTSAPVLTEEL